MNTKAKTNSTPIPVTEKRNGASEVSDINELARKVESCEFTLEKIEALTLALWQAVVCGDFPGEMYEWAFVTVNEMSGNCKAELKEISKQLLEISHSTKKTA